MLSGTPKGQLGTIFGLPESRKPGSGTQRSSHRSPRTPREASEEALEEFRAPLDDSDSPVSQAGLSVEHCETRVVPCPFAGDFQQHGDTARFAADYVPTLRSWSAATFRSGLSTDRPDGERDRIIDAFYGAYETMVREAPEGHAMDYVHVYLTIMKS